MGMRNNYSLCQLNFFKSGFTLLVSHFNTILFNPEFKKAYFIKPDIDKKEPRQLQELVTSEIIKQGLDTLEWPNMIRKTAKSIESRTKFYPEAFNKADYPFFIYRPELYKPLHFSNVDPITYSKPVEKRPNSDENLPRKKHHATTYN